MNEWPKGNYGLRRRIARMLAKNEKFAHPSFWHALGGADVIMGPDKTGVYSVSYSTREALALAREYITDDEYTQIMAAVLGGNDD